MQVRKFSSWTISTAAALLALSAVAGGGDEVKTSTAFVNSLDLDCAFTDGYVCVTTPEDDFLSAASDKAMIPGPWLAAWQKTIQDMQNNPELDPTQKELKHYKFGFTQDADHYIILHRALLLPRIENGAVTGILRSSIGQTTRYWVDRKTLQVTRRNYLR